MQGIKSKSKRSIIIGSLLLVAVWALWCFFFLNKGICRTDEGLYLSEAWRFAHGDLPFRDSIYPAGLSFWWTSWIFHIYPKCGLLGLRVIWAIFMLLCAFVTAKMMLRYFNPWISFAGPAIVLVLPTTYYIKVLGYNSLPVLPLFLAVLLWISARRQNGKPQLLLAAGAGFMAFLATTCRPTFIATIILPALTIIYDYLCGCTIDRWIRAAAAFVSAYMLGCAIFFLVLASTGLMDSFSATFFWLSETGAHSYTTLFNNFIVSIYYYLLPTIPILAIMLIWRFKNIAALQRKYKIIALYAAAFAAVFILVITILNWHQVKEAIYILVEHSLALLNGPYPSSLANSYLLILALAIGVVLANVLLNIFDSSAGKGSIETQDRCHLGFLAVFLSILMVLGTASVPANSVDHISFLPISMAAGMLWLWVPKTDSSKVRKGCFLALRVAVIGLLVLVPCYRLLSGNLYIRADDRIDFLVAMPKTTKLHGIYTTPDSAQTMDRLVKAVKQFSQPGDRILAYENLTMLYYLSDRLPAVDAIWMANRDMKSFRAHVLEDMISRNRRPKLVIHKVRSLLNPRWCWSATDPIDTYVRENYMVIQEIGGCLQIMIPRE